MEMFQLSMTATRTKYSCIALVIFLISPSLSLTQSNSTFKANSTSYPGCPSECDCFTSENRNITVIWGYNGYICDGQTSLECYKESDPRGFVRGPRQWPVVLQLNDRLFFKATSKVSLSMKPFNVTKKHFDSCEFSSGTAVIPFRTSSLFEVPSKFINTLGIKYFIAESDSMVYRCNFGLKLEVYVRSKQPCINPFAKGSDVCSNKGLCATCPKTFFTFNSSCLCETGYVGSYCEERNSCHSTLNPCLNGATCVDKKSGLADDYVCRCVPGYRGKRCQNNIDDCVPDPCKNGAACIDKVDGYQCLCAPGYHGNNCSDLRPNPCEPNPCINGGICNFDSRVNYTCTCPYPFGGKNCSDNVTSSSSVMVLSSITAATVGKSSVLMATSSTLSLSSMQTDIITHTTYLSGTSSIITSSTSEITRNLSSPVVVPSVITSTYSKKISTVIFDTVELSSQIVATSSGSSMNSSLSLQPVTATVMPSSPLLSTEVQAQTATVMSEVAPIRTATVSLVTSLSSVTASLTMITSVSTTLHLSVESSDLAASIAPLSSVLSTDTLSSVDISSLVIATPSVITTTTPVSVVTSSSYMTPSLSLVPTSTSSSMDTSFSSVLASPSAVPPSSLVSFLSTESMTSSSSVIPTTSPTLAPTTIPLKEQTCKNNPCNNGTCLDVPDSLGLNFTCQCPKPTYGPRCSQEFKLHFPRFGNNSYLVHKPIAFPSGFNKIVITFKTTQENGLLFYSTHKKYRDFIQLYITNGLLEYRFDPGDSLVAIRSTVKVNTGKIVTAVVTYDSRNKEGSLQVDNNESKKTKARGKYLGIGLYSEWYIGGLPPGKNYGVNDEAKSTQTLHGCIKDLELNGDQIKFTEATDWNNLNECDQPCEHKPCHNNGSCVADTVNPHDYQCICPDDFKGKNCKTPSVCYGDPCKGGLCIANATNSGIICLCPFGRGGFNCGEDINITVPTFSMVQNYASYIQYQTPFGSVSYFAITLQFKIDNSTKACGSCLLVFSGQDQYQGKGDDFVALGISGNKVVLQYNLGSGVARISSDTLDDSLEWHSVTAGRRGKQGFIYVDNQVPKQGSSPGELQGLNLYSGLYIGGLPDLTELPSNVDFKSGFQGSITNAGVRFDPNKAFTSLSTSQKSSSNAWAVVSGRNIGDKSYHGCNISNPCQNNGTCVAQSASVFCNCSSGWNGMFCSSRDIPCISHNPCAPKSTCREVNNKALCDCPLGKTGLTCSQSLSIQQPRFKENSYMAFNPSNGSGQRIYIRPDTNIKIKFNPSNASGILFYVAYKISSQKRDFLSISLHNGYVHYRYDLGSGLAKLQSAKPVALNTPHTIEVTRISKKGTLKVDSQTVISETSPGDSIALDVESDFYLGGLPQLSSLNPQAVADSSSLKDFVGCVASVEVNKVSLVLNENGAKAGRNIDNCPSPILS